MFVQTEITPNPNSLKFLPGKTVSNSSSFEISKKEETNNWVQGFHGSSLQNKNKIELNKYVINRLENSDKEIKNIKKELKKVYIHHYIAFYICCFKKFPMKTKFRFMEKKFDFNNDIITYQNMMNEFEILKNLILDEDENLIEILKFISKTSINLDSDIQDKRNELLNNIFEKNEYNYRAEYFKNSFVCEVDICK